MIRSNPTAIPLRASDLKHLQSELERRKASAATDAASGKGDYGSGDGGGSGTGGGSGKGKGKGKSEGSAEDGRTGIDAAQAREGSDVIAEQKRERQGRSVADRIGL